MALNYPKDQLPFAPNGIGDVEFHLTFKILAIYSLMKKSKGNPVTNSLPGQLSG
jgi:hypothetical protein